MYVQTNEIEITLLGNLSIINQQLFMSSKSITKISKRLKRLIISN